MNNIEFIKQHNYLPCHNCNGQGKIDKVKCKVCKGTGKWNEDNYILVATKPNGERIAFQVDSLK